MNTTNENSTEQHEKRRRLTKAEYASHRERAYQAIEGEKGVDLYTIAKRAKLTYPEAIIAVRNLVADGRVVQNGKKGKRYLYSHPNVAAGEKPVKETAEGAEETSEVNVLPGVSINTILNQIHLGRELQVVGLHFQAGYSDPIIELRSKDGESVEVALIK